MADYLDKLKGRVDRNREDRERERTASKPYRDRLAEIMAAPHSGRMDFWCDTCQADFTAHGQKDERHPKHSLPIAFYVAFCPRTHRCIRRITDKLNDPYYYKSEMVRRQRVDLADAFLTPDHPRFRVVYPEQWRKIQEQRQLLEAQQV